MLQITCKARLQMICKHVCNATNYLFFFVNLSCIVYIELQITHVHVVTNNAFQLQFYYSEQFIWFVIIALIW